MGSPRRRSLTYRRRRRWTLRPTGGCWWRASLDNSTWWMEGEDPKPLDIGGRVCSYSERGLLGVAVDPNFGDADTTTSTSTTPSQVRRLRDKGPSDPVNRVSRFTMSGNTLNPGSGQILLNNIPSPAGNHNGGDLKFGKDKLLYVSVGDGGCDYEGDSGCGGPEQRLTRPERRARQGLAHPA